MTITLQEMIDRAAQIALAGTDPTLSPVLDVEMTAEALLPHVFAAVEMECAASPRRRSFLRKSKTVAVSNGAGALADDVLTKYLSDAVLSDPADRTKLYAWVPEWIDFVRPKDRRLGYYSVNGQTLAMIEPGATYDAAAGFTGDVELVIPCGLTLPTLATDPVVIHPELADDIVLRLAAALKDGLFETKEETTNNA